MARIKHIPIEQLCIGMYIAEQGNVWIPEQNRKRGGEVKNQAVIDQVIASGTDQVVIDLDKGVDCTGQKATGKSSDDFCPTTFEREQEHATELRDQALDLVQSTMENVKKGKSIDVGQVDALAEDMVGSIYSNQNALICLSQIRSKDTYLLEHSCNVGLLLGVLAKGMGFEPSQVQELITAGMLHDIGKIRIDDAILHKEGKLEADEWQEMKNHVPYGISALEQAGNISAVIMSVCGQHHERLDGGGYPAGLAAEEITLYGRMAAVVDVYDAVTADRCYHKGMVPSVAMKRLNEWSGDHLDREIVHHFVRAMSVYPVGSLVELSSGELGLVMEVNTLRPDCPQVKLIYSLRSHNYIAVEWIDLASSSETRTIVRPVEAKKYAISIGDFI